jgi:phospholipid/cholesterol/gamma-HCH transport system substrate-binding protein
MNERKLRFRIGLFALGAIILLAILISWFNAMPALFQRHNNYTVQFSEAPGVAEGTPVRRSGVRVGQVQDVQLDEETGMVRVVIGLEPKYQLRKNEVPTLRQGLLGDTAIDLVAQVPEEGEADRAPVEKGAEVAGKTNGGAGRLVAQASDVVPNVNDTLVELRKLVKAVDQIMPKMDKAVEDFSKLAKSGDGALVELRRTAEEIRDTAVNWGRVGLLAAATLQANQKRLDSSMENLDNVLRRLNGALSDENVAHMSTALKNLSSGSASLGPALQGAEKTFLDAQKTLERIGGTVTKADSTLDSLNQAIAPIAQRSDSLARNLDEVAIRLNRTITTVDELLQAIARQDGTVFRLLADPSLYNNINHAICMVIQTLPRLDRVLRDMEIFADKLARHPEVIGIGGAIRPGFGIK